MLAGDAGPATHPNPAAAAAARMDPPPKALLILGDGLLVGDASSDEVPAPPGGAGPGRNGPPASLAAARPLPHLDGLAARGGAGMLVCVGRRGGGGGGDAPGSAADSPLAQILGLGEEVRGGGGGVRGGGGRGRRALFCRWARVPQPSGWGAPGGEKTKTHARAATALTGPTLIPTISVHTQTPPLTLSARFQGMAGALLSDEKGAQAVGEAGGLTCYTLCDGYESFLPPLPPPNTTAARIGALLGLSEPGGGGAGGGGDDSGADLLILQTPPPGRQGDRPAASTTLAWVDELLASVSRLPGARAGLIICVILGGAEGALPLPTPGGGPADLPSLPPIARPAQTFELALCGGGTAPPLFARSLYIAARCPGVMRTDALARVDPAGAARGGALGATAAAHLLPELAYKMGRAPKYGA